MSSTHGRQVYANQLVYEQVDFFQVDNYTRIPGLTPGDLGSVLTFNNSLQPWLLVDGLAVPDIQCVSSRIYINEITGLPGFYSVRFRPHAVGYWRILLSYDVVPQYDSQDFDVVAVPPTFDAGLKASFMRRPC